MIYLDANVFVFAASRDDAVGHEASKVLRNALRGRAATATLTADEVLWALSKKLGRAAARQKVEQLLALDVEILPVARTDIEDALRHHADGLDPRDAIHAAVALAAGCERILTQDSDFDKVAGLVRVPY